MRAETFHTFGALFSFTLYVPFDFPGFKVDTGHTPQFLRIQGGRGLAWVRMAMPVPMPVPMPMPRIQFPEGSTSPRTWGCVELIITSLDLSCFVCAGPTPIADGSSLPAQRSELCPPRHHSWGCRGSCNSKGGRIEPS